MKTYEVGDKLVYPGQGVAEVTSIDEKELSGVLHQFYCLRVLDTDMRILVPVDKAEVVGIRDLERPEVILAAFKTEREIKRGKVDSSTWNRRYRRFMEQVKSGDVRQLVEVAVEMTRRSQEVTLSFGERRMLDTAFTMLVKEYGAACGVSPEKANRDVRKALTRDVRKALTT